MKITNPEKLGLSKEKIMAMENFFKEKYIQNADIVSFGGNELSILNAHNPIRIFNQASFSFVYKLEKEFLDVFV